MTATLHFDVGEAESLVTRGADPVNAREATPFSKGDLLSPLAALLLQGTFTPEAIQMAQFLIDHGASLNDLMNLPGPAHFHNINSTAGRGIGSSAGADNTTTTRLGGNSGQRASIVEGKDQPHSRNGRPLSTSSTRHSVEGLGGNEGAAGEPPGSSHGGLGNAVIPHGTVEQGTVLHYVVALGDWAHLLQILTIAGQRRPTLPQSLMHEIVLGIMIPPKPSQTEERASSRGRKLNSSVSRQPSRSASRSAALGGAGNEVPHAPRSALPPLRSIPVPFSPALRLKIHNPTNVMPSSVLFGSIPGSSRALSLGAITNSPTIEGQRSSIYEGKQRGRVGSVATGLEVVTSSRVTVQSEAGGGGNFLPVGNRSSMRDSRRRMSSLASPTILVPPDGIPSPTAKKPSAAAAVIGSKGSPRTNGGENAFSSSSLVLGNIIQGSHLDLCFDFSVKSSTGLPVADWALDRGDVTATRLLTFYGAKIDFQRLVNGSQTALARACSTGDLTVIERLLDAGDTLTQISADGRYTLVHYAVAHPPVLEYLARRGLSLDFENAFGESALHSLIVHGYGRNSENAIRDTPKMQDAAKLAALPLAAVRNYILTPLPVLLGGGGAGGAGGGGGKFSKPGGGRGGGGKGNTSLMRSDFASMFSPNALTAGMSREDAQRKMRLLRLGGGGDCGTWWSFSSLSTSDMIQHLFDAGANIHGNIPPEECDLRYTIFAEEMSRHRAATLAVLPNANQGFKKRASLPSPSLMMEEPVPTYDPNELWFTDGVQFGRKPYRSTPLMCAIDGYHPELIRKLIMEYHVDLSRRDSLGASCLHHAAICPHPSVLELLATCGSQEWNAVDMAGRTPLHYAVLMGNIAAMKVLLRNSAVLAGKPDVHGLTPLHLAVLANESVAVGLLLRHSDTMVSTTTSGVSVTNAKPSRRQKNTKSSTASLASGMSGGGLASSGTTTAPSSLVGGGVSGAGSTIGGPLGAGGAGRLGGTGGAVEFQMIEVDAEDYVEHCTPLEFAIKYQRDPSIIQLLLQEGRASMQRWSGLESGGSLLHRAVVDGREDYTRLLLENYANPNEPDNEDRTALYLAVDTDKPNIPLIQSLMQADAYPFAQSATTLCTPLHIAAARGNPEVINLLFHERVSPSSMASYSSPSIPYRASHSLEDLGSQPRRQLRTAGFADGSGNGESESETPGANGGSASSTEKGNAEGWGSPSSFSFTAGLGGEQGNMNETHRPKGTPYSIFSSPLIANAHFLCTDSHGRVTLHILCSHTTPAAQQRVLPFIEQLVRCSTALEMCGAMDAQGRTPLHDACRAAFHEAICLLLAVDPLLVYCVDANGHVPLHDAVYSSIRRYPRLLSVVDTSPSERGFSRSTATGIVENASSTFSISAKEERGMEEGSAQPKGEDKREEESEEEANRDPPYSEEELARRTENIIVLLADVVQRSAPRPLRGYPLINSNVNTFSPYLSITQQIIRKHLYAKRWEEAPDPLTFTDSSSTPWEDMIIRSVRDYLRITDQHGRTALLLAGELGNNVATSTLLRIGKVLPILSNSK